MRGIDFMPYKDSDLLRWATNFLAVLFKIMAQVEFSETVYQELLGLLNTYREKLSLADAPETRTKATVQAKNDARKILKRRLRASIAEYLTHNHLLTDADRDNLGLPVYDTKPTPAPLPTDMPAGEVDTSTHQQHRIRVKSGTLTGKTKPQKVHGYEVWRKIGGNPPADDSEYTYVCLSTRSLTVIDYPLTDVGKMVYYRFRWVNTRNQPGPWSEGYLSAVIP
ncbi:MAG: hypothetical protein LBH90_05270 [Tannerella sp.]|jgi:hypothetical protein|nr:hypothetical protein [Tannerella sp.]